MTTHRPAPFHGALSSRVGSLVLVLALLSTSSACWQESPEPEVEECPYHWLDAPCGEEWELLYACDPCGTVYFCADHSGTDILPAWGGTTLPCSCITADGQRIQEGACGQDEGSR